VNVPGPLDGVRILDMSIALTGPYATALLADQGAEVIKVERPGIGDIGRWVGVSVNGVSALFQACNRGKRSLALDVHSDDGREVFRALAATCDVVVQNFRPGVCDKLGIGHDDLAEGRDDLIYVSLSGFGEDGPYGTKSAYDTVIQAYGGLASAQADPQVGEPVFIRQTAADKVTAMYAVQAITAALFARERGAGGQHLRLSMLDAVVSFLWADAAGNEMLLDSDGTMASSFVQSLRPLRFLDGWGVANPTSDADFHGMCAAFGVEGADDPRVATIGERRQHPELSGRLMHACYEAAETMTTEEAMARLEAHRVPSSMVVHPAELHRQPQAVAMGLFEESVHPVAGRLRQPRHPTRYAGTPARLGGPSPMLGEHTDQILDELGFAARVDELRRAGVVA
jgi:crotonobetainyl-CoA:carnitine CoA-transferase CaiB-like acyl-CoA transferase